MEQTEEKKEWKKTRLLIIFLLFIIVVVIIILCYKNFYNPKSEEVKKIPIETQISEYEGENISGAEVKLMLAKIISEELEKSNISLSKIEYNYKNEEQEIEDGLIEIKKDNKSDNVQKIVQLRNLIINQETYEVKYQKENNAISFISIKIKERN